MQKQSIGSGSSRSHLYGEIGVREIAGVERRCWDLRVGYEPALCLTCFT